MGVFSTKPHLVSCTGSTLNTVIMLDHCPYSTYGVQSPPRFEELSIKSLIHKKGYSVFGKIDLFSVLQFVVVSLGNSLDLDWVLLSPELSKVGILFTINGHCLNYHTSTSTFYFRLSDHANWNQWTSYTLSRTVTSLEQSGCILVQEHPLARRYCGSQTSEYTRALQT